MQSDRLDQLLINSVSLGNIKLVRHFIKKGANVSAKHNQPLCSASQYGCLNIVKYLIEKGADPNMGDNWSIYPICWASSNGHLNVVKYLTNTYLVKKDDNSSHISEALSGASLNGFLNVVKYLIKLGPNSTYDNNHRFKVHDDLHYTWNHALSNALKNAAHGEHIDVVKYIFKKYNTYNHSDDGIKYTLVNNLKIVKYFMLCVCNDSDFDPFYLSTGFFTFKLKLYTMFVIYITEKNIAYKYCNNGRVCYNKHQVNKHQVNNKSGFMKFLYSPVLSKNY